jgi:hypothetical protein
MSCEAVFLGFAVFTPLIRVSWSMVPDKAIAATIAGDLKLCHTGHGRRCLGHSPSALEALDASTQPATLHGKVEAGRSYLVPVSLQAEHELTLGASVLGGR